MSVTKSVVKKICLSLIGGSPLAPIPTTTVMGTTIVTQVGGKVLSSLTSAANEISSAVGTLSAITENPIGGLVDDIKGTIENYTKNNFQELDSVLNAIATDPTLSTVYGELKKAMGGGDGIGGCFSELQKFKEHTDRISGVTVASDSDLSKPLTNPQTPGGR
jgi:hypothetical protein